MLLQAEYRWEISRLFELALFGDTGTVANQGKRLDLDQLKSDFGFGFRVKNRISDPVRQAADIRAAVQPVELVHPDLRVVDHPNRDKYTLISLPSSIARDYDCRRIQSGQLDFSEPAQLTYDQ